MSITYLYNGMPATSIPQACARWARHPKRHRLAGTGDVQAMLHGKSQTLGSWGSGLRAQQGHGQHPARCRFQPEPGAASPSSAPLPSSAPEDFHVRFWKPYRPRGAGSRAPAGPREALGGPRGRHQDPGDARGRQPCDIASGPGSRNLGPPAAVASCVTHPIGLGNSGEEGCRIWIRMMPFCSLKGAATCSTIAPSWRVWTSWLSRRSVARTLTSARTTRHFFGG
mmetsp:Transcript_35450/g.98079  ORF Transcript_35450/g.98079 Transcript_35450/m.98079 type:complete len:225 (+) Transcript_35450:52-726(+)